MSCPIDDVYALYSMDISIQQHAFTYKAYLALLDASNLLALHTVDVIHAYLAVHTFEEYMTISECLDLFLQAVHDI